MFARLMATGISDICAGLAIFSAGLDDLMTDFIILIRNIVLAALLAWLGMEFAPKQPEPKPDENRDSSLTVQARP